MRDGFITPPKHVNFEAKVLLGEEEVIIRQDEAYLVQGSIPHSVWSNTDNETVMIGISVR